ncbi:MAG: hypothetical protein JRG86_20740 [Deltaproteobacteria bacterium]|jgi:hypothetical protein|nr:hypothetical protein [Deltaproteobacteria bacterium]MBW2499642.1 hypothetical protein [Deltaproteobacteria bacterium]
MMGTAGIITKATTEPARTMRRIAILALALVAVALHGCSGFGEAYESRVCWEGSSPAQCQQASILLECSAEIEIQTIDEMAATSTLATRAAEGVLRPVVGELFSQWCPPDCIPIHLAGLDPWDTLERDVREILERAGYQLAAEEKGGVPIVALELPALDVRSDDPGLLSMRITTRARARFRASVVGPDGQPAWSQEFGGTAEVKHAYAALSDYENALGEAYCGALREFARVVGGGTLEAPLSAVSNNAP